MSAGLRFPECAQLPEFLTSLECRGSFQVALSGGADSSALLLALAEVSDSLDAPLAAIHINHSVHPDAAVWETHCRALCTSLGIPLQTKKVQPMGDTGEGPEAELRRLRYLALEALMDPADVLLTGHHSEDQAETVLLNLARGSGPAGLAGMPRSRAMGTARLARPLLGTSRSDLESFLEDRGVGWIEDSSNQDVRYDRNFIRQQVLPLLRQRWPAMDSALARSAQYSGEAAGLLKQVADQWLQTSAGPGPVLHLESSAGACADHTKLLLRRWLEQRQAPPLPAARVEEFCRQLVNAGPQHSISLAWSGMRLDYFQQKLYLRKDSDFTACPEKNWNQPGCLDLGPVCGTLDIEGQVSGDWPSGLRITPRMGGEKLSPGPGRPRRSVKSLLREAGVPVWMRSSIPLLRQNGDILAIGDWIVAPDLQAWLGSTGSRLTWRPREITLKCLHEQLLMPAVATDTSLR